jgi:hypothetical protein
MFLGRQVDDAITLYYRHILDHGERLSVDQLKDAFWTAGKLPPRPSASNSGSPGRPTCARTGHSSSASTRSSSPSAS